MGYKACPRLIYGRFNLCHVAPKFFYLQTDTEPFNGVDTSHTVSP